MRGTAKEIKFMENNQPLVSVITPVFNGEQFLEENILSVKSQDYGAIEHIIVDGGSEDGTLDIIKKYEGSYNLRWLSEKDKGIADAMNKGFKMAEGEIFCWLDADNYYEPNVISRVVGIMTSGTEPQIVCGHIKVIDQDGKLLRLYRVPRKVSFKDALRKNTAAIPSQPGTFFKKDIYASAGGFDLSYKIAGDFDFWLKILKNNPSVYFCDMVFGAYRKTKASASQSIRGVWCGLKEMLRIGDIYGQSFPEKALLCLKYLFSFLLSVKNLLIRS